MKKVHSLEKGQIVVLLALALIALLAFTALAIDGGMIYADRRYMQSAADAASIAGAGSIASALESAGVTNGNLNCGDLMINTGINVAIDKANEHGFVDNGSTDIVEVKVDNCTSSYVDVRVTLTHETNTSFVHLINGEPMKNTVTSTTRVELSSGYAIVALRQDCAPNDVGVTITGETEVLIIDGGIWSNSCMTYDGNSLSVKVDPPMDDSIVYNTELNPDNPDNVVPPPVKKNRLHYATDMEMEINCPDEDPPENIGPPKNDESLTIYPGNIGDITMPNGEIILTGGLYCINGTVNLTGGTIKLEEDEETGIPKGVTLYFTGNKFTINGNVHVELASPNMLNAEGEDCTSPDCNKVLKVGDAQEDLLMYVPRDVAADISLNGNAGSTIGGIIFAPNSSIDVGGTTHLGSGETLEFTTSIIGLDVKVHGTPGIEIRYDYGAPVLLHLWK